MAKINRVCQSDLSLCPDIQACAHSKRGASGPARPRSRQVHGRRRHPRGEVDPLSCWRAGGTHREKPLPKTASAEPSRRHPGWGWGALEEAVCPEATRLYIWKGRILWYVGYYTQFKKAIWGTSLLVQGYEFTFQCRGCRFDPWLGS